MCNRSQQPRKYAGVLLRVLDRFSNLNIVPDPFIASCGRDEITIEIDAAEIPPATLAELSKKRIDIRQAATRW